MAKVVFFGSSQYSTIILSSLLKIPDFQLLAVVTKPNKPSGRSQVITKNPVSAFASDHHLPLLQPSQFDTSFKSVFSSLSPDLGLVVAYGPPFFTQDLIDIPRYKIVNIHPSPLPKYRGATPGPWQIINGETKSAVTFFQIDALPDHGPIITQIPFDISPTQTADSFYQKAFKIASDHLESVLKSYIQNPSSLTPQDHSQKTYFPKFSKDNAQIDWTWEPVKIERFIRALYPWPIAWTYVTDSKQRLLKMKVFSSSVKGKDLCLGQVQIEGKNPISWSQISSHYTPKLSL